MKQSQNLLEFSLGKRAMKKKPHEKKLSTGEYISRWPKFVVLKKIHFS